MLTKIEQAIVKEIRDFERDANAAGRHPLAIWFRSVVGGGLYLHAPGTPRLDRTVKRKGFSNYRLEGLRAKCILVNAKPKDKVFYLASPGDPEVVKAYEKENPSRSMALVIEAMIDTLKQAKEDGLRPNDVVFSSWHKEIKAWSCDRTDPTSRYWMKSIPISGMQGIELARLRNKGLLAFHPTMSANKAGVTCFSPTDKLLGKAFQKTDLGLKEFNEVLCQFNILNSVSEFNRLSAECLSALETNDLDSCIKAFGKMQSFSSRVFIVASSLSLARAMTTEAIKHYENQEEKSSKSTSKKLDPVSFYLGLGM